MKKLSLLTGLCALISVPLVNACSITYNYSTQDIEQTMNEGFDWHGGWDFKEYSQVCRKLNKNNAQLNIGGMIWEHEKDNYIAYYSILIADKKSILISPSFGQHGILMRSNYKNKSRVYVELFNEINNEIDAWYVSGSFDSALEEYNKNKLKMKGL